MVNDELPFTLYTYVIKKSADKMPALSNKTYTILRTGVFVRLYFRQALK